MRSVIAILLLSLFTAQTELGQLYRLPYAVQHYATHRQEAKGMTLLQFLLEHYNNQHQDDDMAADKQLPFNNFNPLSITSIYMPAAPTDVAFQPLQIFQKPFTPFIKKKLSQHSFAIFHPPQNV